MRFPEFSGEWESTPISNIADIIGGGTPDTSVDEYWGGNIQWFTPSEIGKEKYAYLSDRTITEAGLKNSSAKLLPQGTVLLSTRATIGECSIATAECTTNQGFQSLVAKKNNASSEFLYYIVAKIKREMLRRSCGSTFLEISANELKKIHANIPSKAEQEKLVSLLSLIDQRIETQKKIIEDLKKLKDAISKLLFRHRVGNEYSIGELCKSIAVKQYISIDVAIDGTYPIIQQGESPVAGYTESAPFFDYEKVVLFGDHTLSIYRPNVPFLLSTDGIKILRPNDLVLRDYLYYLLYAFMPKSEGYKRHYSILKDICVPVPDIDTQKSIVEELLSVDSKIEIEARFLELQIQQKEYLLNQMFI